MDGMIHNVKEITITEKYLLQTGSYVLTLVIEREKDNKLMEPVEISLFSEKELNLPERIGLSE